MAGIIGTTWAKNSKQSKMRLERLKPDEMWEIITDKRFGIRFKIANLICRDYLRNYLAAANHRVHNCIEILDSDCYSDETKIRYINRNMRRVNKTLEDVFDF